MVKVAKFYLLLIFCSFAYAADGLTLYTDPDFPNFSFEYDPSEWTIEVIISDDPHVLKRVVANNPNGEQLIFHFEAFRETGFDGAYYPWREDEVEFVGDIAVRVDNNYYPKGFFISCIDEKEKCEKVIEQNLAVVSSLEKDVVALGDTVCIFYTEMSEEFINELNVDDETKEWWGNRAWLCASIEPAGLESYQADTIISTLTY
jgi:hypothetical protein